MNRRLGVASAIAVALAVSVTAVLWRRAAREGGRSATAPAPARATGTAGGTDAGARAAPASNPSGAPDTDRPHSPFGAAPAYAARLRSCEPPTKPPGPNPPVTCFGRGEPGWGVTFQLTAAGDILGAALWGRTGAMESCLTNQVRSWPIADSGKRAITLQFPMHDIAYGRRPAGEVQILASTLYDERAISPALLKGDWLAICPRTGGAELIPAAPIATREESLDATFWEVKSSACPGDDVVMVKGAGLGCRTNPAASPDGGAADASPPESTDGGAERCRLPTLTVDPAKLIGAEGTTLTLGDRSVRLFTQDVVGNGEAGQQILLLASGAVVQVLGEVGSEFRLIWAGDLDGDGVLDLVTCNFPEAPTYDLFLSSRTGGRLIRHAARVVGTDGD